MKEYVGNWQEEKLMHNSREAFSEERMSDGGTSMINMMAARKPLSKREVDILGHIKEGMKNPEIAEHLNLSTKTVENHVRNILLKLRVKNRTQAVVEGLRSSIIQF